MIAAEFVTTDMFPFLSRITEPLSVYSIWLSQGRTDELLYVKDHLKSLGSSVYLSG